MRLGGLGQPLDPLRVGEVAWVERGADGVAVDELDGEACLVECGGVGLEEEEGCKREEKRCAEFGWIHGVLLVVACVAGGGVFFLVCM